MPRPRILRLTVLGCLFILSAGAFQSTPRPAAAKTAADPDLDHGTSELRSLIERYSADRGSVGRFFTVDASATRRIRFKEFYTEWQSRLAKTNFNGLSQDGKVDYVLFRNYLEHELARLEIDAKSQAEIAPYIPFAETIVTLEETRRKLEPINARDAAATLDRLAKQVDAARRAIEQQMRAASGDQHQRRVLGNRAAGAVLALRATLRSWNNYFEGYDPLYTWWAAEPYKTADAALQNYASFLRERVAGLRGGAPEMAAGGGPGGGGRGGAGGGGGGRGGAGGGGGRGGGGGGGGAPGFSPTAGARAGESDDIIGNPIGREALIAELTAEMVPYSPEELVAIANKEFAWCENEMRKASRELGFGDDWKRALEHVKNLHVEPGKQTEVIRDLAREAVKFLEDNDLITVPPLAKETWRMEMMSPERQLVNPFFTGGETISVSYPTAGMSHEQKLMSMRGNNPHFSRATVHHELIPGHHLQGFMAQRYKNYRGLFSTPFYGEGWALYWELFLWDRGFFKTPQDRVGALFWRMHRCARIIFSLSFHLSKMTPQECIDFLVDRVGHERDNATGEVRRSFGGGYGPLYQAAYLLGGMQIYAMQRELTGPGKMTYRQFHDSVLREGRIPIEMIRASLSKQSLTREHKTTWKFYGPNPGQ